MDSKARKKAAKEKERKAAHNRAMANRAMALLSCESFRAFMREYKL